MQDNWKKYYTFHDFPTLNMYKIPKEGLQTWSKLKQELEDFINIQFQNIDICINNRKVFYAEDTLMEDIDIKKNDMCVALLKPKHKDEKQKLIYEKEKKQIIQKNENRIKQALNDPQNKKALSIIKKDPSLERLYKDLIKQYSKWECLIAIKDNSNNFDKIKQSLQSGQARNKLEKKIEINERKYIDQFLQTKELKQLKAKVFDKYKEEKVYGKIMLKLYEKYPKFRQVEINHQEYIQLKLLGKTLYDFEISKPVQIIFKKVNQDKSIKTLTQQEYTSFFNKHKKASQKQIKQALQLSGYNLDKAQMLMEKGFFDPNLNYSMTLKKKARLNLIIQLFSRPDLEPIRETLKGNKERAQAFVGFFIQKQKDNIILSKLLKKYKNYIVSILTSINCGSQQKLQNNNLIFQNQLSTQQQKIIIKEIQESVDKKLVNQLKKLKFDQKTATSIARASENVIEQCYEYIYLKEIPVKYDFCIPDKMKQQIYLEKQFKKQKELLQRLKNKKQQILWLASIKQKSPFLFEIIIRNKLFFDRLIEGNAYQKEVKVKQEIKVKMK